MILEVNRIVSTWLADATHGASAMLAQIPLDDGDSAPEDFALVTDETQDGDVARDVLPEDSPSLSVSVDSVEDLDGQVQQVDADGDVRLRIRIGLANAVTADGRRDLSYYMRATMMSFRALMEDANAASRTRNQVYLESCQQITEAIVNAKDQDGSPLVVGYIIPVVRLRDLQPYPTS